MRFRTIFAVFVASLIPASGWSCAACAAGDPKTAGTYLGMTLMALFLGCLEYTLEEGPRLDWLGDPVILTTAWISAIASVLFVWRSLAYAHPVVDLRALKDRNFALGCFFSFITGVGIFATIYLTPLFLGRVRGYSALEIGEAVLKCHWNRRWGIPARNGGALPGGTRPEPASTGEEE